METNVNEKRVFSWLGLFMYAYLIVGTILLANASLGGDIPDEYKSNLLLFWGEKVCIFVECVLALYTFLALYQKWPNAVYMSYTYLGVIIFINCINLLFGSINATGLEKDQIINRSVIGIVAAVIWLIYFYFSKEVNMVYPKEKRRLLGRDVIIICVAILIPAILLLLRNG